MKDPQRDEGVLQALLERLSEQRLPRLLALKQKVDAGQTLAEQDLSFLRQVSEDWEQAKPFIDRQPKYQDLVAKVVHLYGEIAAKALENEG
ncbi:hypothetical protein [Thiocapsa bogorovii]|uniref:hypothetical protein n=1 Tax=Thiocapsa bogorovii TaxID=521689 RepID=UPI001E2DDEB2|nr:hypothetical protein [Thiocapsa bogorovii]UHD18028.1 hypothetical protein LT988_08320 [Thiocapsa bogorovii]